MNPRRGPTPMVRIAAALDRLRTPASERFREERESLRSCTGTAGRRRHIPRRREERHRDLRPGVPPACHEAPNIDELKVEGQRPFRQPYLCKAVILLCHDLEGSRPVAKMSRIRHRWSPSVAVTCLRCPGDDCLGRSVRGRAVSAWPSNTPRRSSPLSRGRRVPEVKSLPSR